MIVDFRRYSVQFNTSLLPLPHFVAGLRRFPLSFPVNKLIMRIVKVCGWRQVARRQRPIDASVAQWIEHQSSELRVAGSSPAGRAVRIGKGRDARQSKVAPAPADDFLRIGIA